MRGRRISACAIISRCRWPPETAAAALDDGVQAHRHPLDVLGEARHLRGGHRLLRRVGLGPADDVEDRAGERLSVLEHHSALTAHRRLVQRREILPVVQHTARDGLVEADQQTQQGGLAAARSGPRPRRTRPPSPRRTRRRGPVGRRRSTGTRAGGPRRRRTDTGPARARVRTSGVASSTGLISSNSGRAAHRDERAGQLSDRGSSMVHRGGEGEESRGRQGTPGRPGEQHEQQQ